MSTTRAKVTRSSGNVFADLGLRNAPEHELKARLVLALDRAIRDLGLTQTAAAERTSIAQPDLSKILRGNVSGVAIKLLADATDKLPEQDQR
jgi:predicted XRE-type DNA-binding protein